MRQCRNLGGRGRKYCALYLQGHVTAELSSCYLCSSPCVSAVALEAAPAIRSRSFQGHVTAELSSCYVCSSPCVSAVTLEAAPAIRSRSLQGHVTAELASYYGSTMMYVSPPSITPAHPYQPAGRGGGIAYSAVPPPLPAGRYTRLPPGAPHAA